MILNEEKEEGKKLFVWDLHGVLERGTERAAKIISNMVLEKEGYPEEFRFTYEQSVKLFGLRWHQYFEHLLPHEPPNRHFELQNLCYATQEADPSLLSNNIFPNDHAYKTLEAIANRHDQILLSNTRYDKLSMFLELVGLKGFFYNGNALGIDDAQTETKTSLLEKAVQGKEYTHIIIIGDSASDMALKDAHVPEGTKVTTYLYTHPGFPVRAKGDYHITDLRKVLREI